MKRWEEILIEPPPPELTRQIEQRVFAEMGSNQRRWWLQWAAVGIGALALVFGYLMTTEQEEDAFVELADEDLDLMEDLDVIELLEELEEWNS